MSTTDGKYISFKLPCIISHLFQISIHVTQTDNNKNSSRYFTTKALSVLKKKKEEPTADIIPVLIKCVNNLTHDACSKQNLYSQQIVLMEKGH